jgi:hypothetical protein
MRKRMSEARGNANVRRARSFLAACLAGAFLASPAAARHIPLTLTEIALLQVVEVSLDVSRFPQDRVATIQIRNPHEFPVRGAISRCDTVFAPDDGGVTALLPAESGNVVVGPRQTVRVTRLFRPVEPAKRAPAGTTRYTLAATPAAYEATWNCTE